MGSGSIIMVSSMPARSGFILTASTISFSASSLLPNLSNNNPRLWWGSAILGFISSASLNWIISHLRNRYVNQRFYILQVHNSRIFGGHLILHQLSSLLVGVTLPIYSSALQCNAYTSCRPLLSPRNLLQPRIQCIYTSFNDII